MSSESPLSITILDREDSENAKVVDENQRIEIEAEYGPADRKPFFIQALDSSGRFVAGLKGFSHWHWLYVSQLWVDESLRGQGLGRDILDAAEAVAKKRFCVGLYVDTFSMKASLFYEKNGFRVIGRIPGFPVGGERIFLVKRV